MLEEARRLAVPVSSAARAVPRAVLHAPVGAKLLAELGLRDEVVLRAVASHTVGRPGMTPLELLVYTADFCEPGRTHEGSAEVREILFRDLKAGAREATAKTLMYLVRSERQIDVATVKTWNDLVKHAKED